MKKIQLLQMMALLPMLCIAFPNNSSFFKANTNYLGSTSLEDTSEITIADSKIVIMDNDSSVNIKFSNNKPSDSTANNSNALTTYQNVDIEIIESDRGTKVTVHKQGDTVQHFEMNFDDFEHATKKEKSNIEEEHKDKTFTFNKKSKKSKFKGHWSGFEFGLNNYLTNDMSLSPSETYMEINSSKSWNYNLNFAQVSIPIYRDRIGFVSGLGFEWSNYHFSNPNTIIKDSPNQTITSKDLSNMALKKNRLQSTYLTAPILLEAQLGGQNSKRVAISGGIITGLKIGSHTKYKTSDIKRKNKDDFYLNPFKYGFTARVHYNDIGLYFNYYNTPLFMNDRGPELYPFAAGLILSFD